MSAGTATRKAKTKIKPPRTHVQGAAATAETWALFARAVREIHNHNAHQLSYEENYRYAYHLCLYKHGEMLYNGVCTLVTENLDRMAKDIITPAFPTGAADDPVHRSQEGERLLKAFRSVWDDHKSSMSKLRDLLKYMDRTYVPGSGNPPIYDAGLDLFIRRILNGTIQDTLLRVLLDLIRVERDGFVINRSAMKSCVDVLLTLGSPSIYKQFIERPILQESESFYDMERQKLLDTCDAGQYLQHVESRLNQEESRALHYLSSVSHPKIRDILQDRLLASSLEVILLMPNSGLDAMVDGDKAEDLGRMYSLFLLVPSGLPALRKELKGSIERRGSIINQIEQEADEEAQAREGRNKGQEKAVVALEWVQSVLDLRDRFDGILNGSFRADTTIESSISEAFESFINRNIKAPEFISLFIDEHLKKGLKGKTDLEVEAVLDKTISVFRYITDKDVFERYYKNHLAKRLLYARSVSNDAERAMLAKLKIECGFQFTQKLEGMFNDIRVSADTTEAYRKHTATLDTPSVDLAVTVMTSTFWPMNHSGATCTLPSMLQQAAKIFERFYLSRHSGRKLTWQPGLGSVDIKANFKTRKHDINLPTLAFVILWQFEALNDGEQLSYEDIRAATDIPDPDLQRSLLTLACGKYKILKKVPRSGEVSTSDRFSFNPEFSTPLQKIKIGVISSKMESSEERKRTQNRIEEERKLTTEACIVRVMKNRKRMTHNDLVNEVTKQLTSRFQPVPLEIKKRIEGLIDKEYLERGDDRKSYNYLA